MIHLNLPTWLTIVRIIILPFFVISFYLSLYWTWTPFICTFLFVIAAITDWFDGFLARLWQQTTQFGAFLDPVADKLMVVTTLVLITEDYHIWWVTLPTVIMIGREIIISSLREWMSELGKRSCVVVSWVGKIKTTIQMISIFGLLWKPNIQIEFLAILLLYLAAILTFWSMVRYLFTALRV